MTERYAIVGNSGSGKSTLARRLAKTGALPVLDLDTVAWVPDAPTTLRPTEQAADDVQAFCRSHESWIVEGCYGELIRATLPFAPKLILLDPGLVQCLANCRARPWEPHKYASKAEQDKNLAFLLEWVEGYYSRCDDLSLQAHKTLFAEYDGEKTHQTTL